MRVTRRIRPSQVGCGATIGRRRLYAASISRDAAPAETPPVSHVAFIIQPDGRIQAVPLSDDVGREPATHAALIASSVSGR